jgi:anti-repressor protein
MVMGRALQIAQRQLDEIKARNLQLTTTVAVQSQQIAELQPKASYYDIVLNCKDLVSTSIIAKDFGKSAVWLNNYLHDKGVQYKQGGIWLLYQKYAEQGYTGTKTNTYNGIDGSQHIRVHTYWTQKGRLFIYGMLKNDDYVPVIERKGRDTINESL